MKLIENNIQKIIALCKKHKVGKLFVFGSILTNRLNEQSDMGMVVDFDKVNLEDYADNYSTSNMHWKIYSIEKWVCWKTRQSVILF